MINEVTNTSFTFRLLKNNPKLIKESIEKDNEEIKLTLRKERLDNLLASKRKMPQIDETQDYSYRIKINDLQLPSEYEINLNKYYENFNLAFLKNYFYSDNIILQKYAVFILLKYLSVDGELSNKRIDYIFTQLDSEFLSTLSKYLIIQDKAFQYETCWVIINLVFNDNTDLLFCDNEDNMKYIMMFIDNSLNDLILFGMGLWLIRNLTSNNIKAKNYFLKNKLLDLFPISISKYPLEDSNKVYMIMIINNLVASKSNLNEYLNQFIEVIPLLASKLSHYTSLDLLRRVIFCLYNISLIDEAIDILLDHTLHIQIMKTLTQLRQEPNNDDSSDNKSNNKKVQYINYIVLYSIKIIGNLLSYDDVQTQRLIQDNMINFLSDYLKDSSYSILYSTLRAISNIASGTVGQIVQLYKKNTLSQVIHIGIEFYKEIPLAEEQYKTILLDIFREVLYIICFCIQGSFQELLWPWLGYSNCVVIVFLCEGLKIYASDYHLIKNLITALTKIINIERNNDIEMNEEIFINTLISHNIEENIKRIQSCCNTEITNLADTFYDDLFG